MVPKGVDSGADHRVDYCFHLVLPGLRQAAQFLSKPQLLIFIMELERSCFRS